MNGRGIAIMVTLGVCVLSHAWAQPSKSDSGSSGFNNLGEMKIGSGLKEALKVGTTNTVGLIGRVDGYFRNQAIKILMPRELQAVETTLRTLGYGPQVDEFIVSMNRAAEQAAPYAQDIFLAAIADMSIDDARRILSGDDTAATQYFRRKTTQTLLATFRPIVDRAMREVGVIRQYQDLLGRYQGIPLLKSVSFDVTQYVVSRALEGLFHVLGEEEKKIRRHPTARVNALLQDVFGR